MKPDVLYEDNHLIAIYKPAGILTQGDKSGDANIMDEVKKYLKEKYHKTGKVFLGLLHRLDRPVSGIILFAKTSKGASRPSEQFRNQTVEKIYHALVLGKPKQNRGVLVNYLRKDEKRKKAMILKDKKPGANLAKLFYEVVASNIELSRSESEDGDEVKLHRPYSLLKIQIKTGKFHQIRAQLSSIGCPILGDIKYGAPFALPQKIIALSATSLSFQLATKKEKKEISVPIPSIWEKYTKSKR